MDKHSYLLFLLAIILFSGVALTVPQTEEAIYIPQQLLDDMTGNKWIPDQEKTLERLKGLKGLVVLVNVSMDLKLQKSPLGRKIDEIKRDIASSLTDDLVAAGIPVTSYAEWKKNAAKPIIRFNYTFYDTNFNTLYVYCEDQYALLRNPNVYKYLTAWQDRDSFSCDNLFNNDTETIKKMMLTTGQSILKEFIETYQGANPGTGPMALALVEPLSGIEHDKILEFMENGNNEELTGLMCFLPAVRIHDGQRGELSPVSDKFFAINEKIMKKYQMCLQRAKIPVTSLSRWEHDSVKAYLKIDMMMSDASAMFTAVLYDKYVLKRNPEQFEYCNIWSFNQSLKGDDVTQAKVMKFLLDQSGQAFKEFARDYTTANPQEDEEKKSNM